MRENCQTEGDHPLTSDIYNLVLRRVVRRFLARAFQRPIRETQFPAARVEG
jgi:hypothetical protein